jgi:hypothetical protein
MVPDTGETGVTQSTADAEAGNASSRKATSQGQRHASLGPR